MKKILIILNRREKFQLSKLSILSLINSIAESLSIAMLIPILTFIFNKGQFNDNVIFFRFVNNFLDKFQNDILSLIILLVSVYLVKAFFQMFFIWYQAKTVLDIEFNISKRVFKSFLFQDYQKAIKKNSSIIMEILSREVKNFGTCLIQITNFLLEASLVLILIFIMLMTFGAIFLKILLILISTVILIYLIFGRKFKNWGYKRHEYASKALKNMMHGINSFKEIKLYNKEDFFNLKYIENLKVGFSYIKLLTFFTSIPRILYEILFILIISSYIYIYSKGSFNLDASIPLIAFAGAAIVRTLPGLSRISSAISQINASTVSVNKIYELLLDKEYSLIKNENKVKKKTNGKVLKDSIQIKNLSFKYENQKQNIIENLNLVIKSGEYVGLKGYTGSGKTTLINLICGLINLQNGEILIDNENISKIKSSWQKEIGYVPQKIYLMDDTIKNNIIFGDDHNNYDDSKLKDILKTSCVSNFINSLPNGVETNVGENGVFLSGGQVQRIGIARALYSQPKFLILDEATNALDINTENQILENLSNFAKKENLTILSVSHKQNTLDHCSKIYEIKDKILNSLK